MDLDFLDSFGRCYRRLLNILYKDHVTNEEVCRKILAAIGEYDELLTLVKKQKLKCFGNLSRSFGLPKTILQGTVKGKKIDGQMKRWEDNIKVWTGMDLASSTRAAKTGQDGKGWLQIHLWCFQDHGIEWNNRIGRVILVLWRNFMGQIELYEVV